MTTIATIDIENIIPFIIVFGIIISKIIQGITGIKKLIPAKSEELPKKKPEYRPAPNELRDFLEKLAGGIPQEIKEPTITASPLPPQQKVNNRLTTQHKKNKRTLPPVASQTATPTHTPTPPTKIITKKNEINHHKKPDDFHWDNKTKKNQNLISPARIANDLISRKSLAKAMLLKEILDKPISLKPRFGS